MKTFNHIIFSIVIFFITLFSIFYISFIDSFCLESATLGGALYNSYLIGSEYFAARNGRNILNSNSVSTDITGISGINDGTAYTSFGDALKETFFPNNNTINLQDLNSIAQQIDVSNLSAQQQSDLASSLSSDSNVSINDLDVYATSVGGFALYYALRHGTDEWAGNSYDNILCKMHGISAIEQENYTNKLDLEFPLPFDSYIYTNSYTNTFKGSNGKTSRQTLYFDNYIFLFTDGTSGTGYYVKALAPHGSSISGSGLYTNSSNQHYPITGISWYGTPTSINVNGVLYDYGPIQYSPQTYPSYVLYSNTEFGSLSGVTDYLGTKTISEIPPYNTELADTSGVPYVVDDLDDLACSISDIYEIIDALRESILTIPINGQDSYSLIDDTLSSTISDAISDAISKGLAITDYYYDGSGEEDDDDTKVDFPIAYWPSFFPDLLPADMFSMFQPIFDIVGSTYSMYGLWILIPSILIFILILYILVSLF